MVKRVYRIPALVVIAVIALVALFRLLDLIPLDEVAVPLPISSAVARIQKAEGGYVIVVDTPRGRARQKMWDNWGPANRTSLYVTPEGWVVALGGPAHATMIAIPEKTAPALVPQSERERTRSETWRYVGAVDRVEDSRKYDLRFYSPGEQGECFEMYGEGESPYRTTHQVPHLC